jgi:anti-sigma B factor antagonist
VSRQTVTRTTAHVPVRTPLLARIATYYDGIDRMVVVADGDIDAPEADELHRQLAAAAAQHPRQLVADLEAVTFLGDAGLQSLTVASQKANAAGCALYVISSSAAVARPVHLTGLPSALNLRDSMADLPSPVA